MGATGKPEELPAVPTALVPGAIDPALLLRIVEEAPVCIAILQGPMHTIVFANAAYRRYAGRETESLIGRAIREVIPEATSTDGLDQVYRSGERGSVREFETPLGDRASTFWDVELVPVRNAERETEAILLLATDVTDKVVVRRAVEAKAQEAEEAQRTLEAAARERQVMLHQRDVLLRELNHRVKNNLQTISSLLGLQLIRATEPEAQAQLEKAYLRIAAIADIHSRLQRNDPSGTIDFGEYLRDLCSKLQSSLVDENQITVAVKAAEVRLDLDRAVSLGLIVHELITNAVKYAFPDSAEGEISVHFGRQDAGYRLVVADNGQGLPQDAARAKKGLGMGIIDALVTQVHGSLRVEQGPGTCFIIDIPG